MTIQMYLRLRYIRDHQVHVEHLRTFGQRTIRALAQRGFISRRGTEVLLTKAGEEALSLARLSERKDAELTDAVRIALRIHALSVVKKAS